MDWTARERANVGTAVIYTAEVVGYPRHPSSKSQIIRPDAQVVQMVPGCLTSRLAVRQSADQTEFEWLKPMMSIQVNCFQGY